LERRAVQSLVRDMHFRTQFITQVVVGVVQLLLSLVPALLLFGYTDEVNGWSGGEVIALGGMYQVVFAILAITVETNMARFSGNIQEGDLDLVLVRPISAQFYVMLQRLQLAAVFTAFTGIGVVVIGLSRVGATPSMLEVIQAIVLVTCGVVLIACCWAAAVFVAFWLTTVGPMEMVFRDFLQAGKYPVAFYPIAIRVFLVGVLPIGFATTFPTSALLGDGSWRVVLVGIAFSAIALMLLQAYWRFAIRFYSSASS
ncbi:MAG TPA: ABC-2 family transporter protein, partial [Thermomicrobiales bacterium]|nr:ABC-2 family transporter protein [Thermomicrobiales bacterium]